MAVLASDIMDKAAALINDTARELYTNAVQLPYLQLANESLEHIAATLGTPIQVKNSTAISVPASLSTPSTLTLPSDFLMPIFMYERAVGETEQDWRPMHEINSVVGFIPTNTLAVWSFFDNNINFPPCTVDREVLLNYERTIASLGSTSSPIDTDKYKRYLERKTAELCARYIGMNSTLADELLAREVGPAQFDLEIILVGNMQGVRHRRGSATRRSLPYVTR